MLSLTFIQSHPMQVFSDEDYLEDYSVRDEYFIRSLKAMEVIMDIDGYILDYLNKRILYITKEGSLSVFSDSKKTASLDFEYLERIVSDEDKGKFETANFKCFDFFYSLPLKRRLNGYYTCDIRICDKNKRLSLINLKTTPLDLTENGNIRLALSVISYPTSDKPGNAYIKMTDSKTVYKYLLASEKFVEVKIQKLTPTGATILKLLANGKKGKEIASIMNISINTVKYHKKRIFAQLEVKNSAEAIQWMNTQKMMSRRQ